MRITSLLSWFPLVIYTSGFVLRDERCVCSDLAAASSNASVNLPGDATPGANPTFSIRTASDPRNRLSDTSVFMNGLHLLQTIARQNNHIVFSRYSTSLSPWNDVRITINPTTRDFQSRFILWTVDYIFARESSDGFYPAIFTLSSDNEEVGTVQVVSSSVTDQEPIGTPLNMTAKPKPRPKPKPQPSVQVEYKSGGRILTKKALMQDLAKALVYLGEQKDKKKCGSFSVGQDTSKLTFSQLSRLPCCGITYADFVDLTWPIAAWLVENNDFAEYNAYVSVNGKRRATITDAAVQSGLPVEA